MPVSQSAPPQDQPHHAQDTGNHACNGAKHRKDGCRGVGGGGRRVQGAVCKPADEPAAKDDDQGFERDKQDQDARRFLHVTRPSISHLMDGPETRVPGPPAAVISDLAAHQAALLALRGYDVDMLLIDDRDGKDHLFAGHLSMQFSIND